jgi:hypothetical protein
MAPHDMVWHLEFIAERQHDVFVAGGIGHFMSFSVQSLCHGAKKMCVGGMAEVNEYTHGLDRGSRL